MAAAVRTTAMAQAAQTATVTFANTALTSAQNQTAAALTQIQATDAANAALTTSIVAATPTHNNSYHTAQADQTQAVASAQSTATTAQANANLTLAAAQGRALTTQQTAYAALQWAWQAAIAAARDLQTQNLAVANAANVAAMATSIQALDSVLTAFQITFDQAQPATAFASVAMLGFLAAAASFWLDPTAGLTPQIQPDLNTIATAIAWLTNPAAQLVPAILQAAQTQFTALAPAALNFAVQASARAMQTWNYLWNDWQLGVRFQGALRILSGLYELQAGVDLAALSLLAEGVSDGTSTLGVLGGAVIAAHGADQILAGLAQVDSSIYTLSYTEQGLQWACKKLNPNLSDAEAARYAQIANQLLSIVGTLGAGTGAALLQREAALAAEIGPTGGALALAVPGGGSVAAELDALVADAQPLIQAVTAAAQGNAVGLASPVVQMVMGGGPQQRAGNPLGRETGTRGTERASQTGRRSPAPDNHRGRFNANRAAQGKSRLPDDWDAHHRIPQEYRDHPEFTDFDFHQPSNIQGVKGSRADVNIHQQITNEWAEFRRLNANATRSEIEAFAARIDARCAQHWFD